MVMDIQERILQLLKKREWSLYKLAKEAGIHETTVYDWFNDNHYTPSRKSLEYICAALDITLAEFYSGVEENTLSEEQTLLLELFYKVQSCKKQIVFDLLRTLSEEKQI